MSLSAKVVGCLMKFCVPCLFLIRLNFFSEIIRKKEMILVIGYKEKGCICFYVQEIFAYLDHF